MSCRFLLFLFLIFSFSECLFTVPLLIVPSFQSPSPRDISTNVLANPPCPRKAHASLSSADRRPSVWPVLSELYLHVYKRHTRTDLFDILRIMGKEAGCGVYLTGF